MLKRFNSDIIITKRIVTDVKFSITSRYYTEIFAKLCSRILSSRSDRLYVIFISHLRGQILLSKSASWKEDSRNSLQLMNYFTRFLTIVLFWIQSTFFSLLKPQIITSKHSLFYRKMFSTFLQAALLLETVFAYTINFFLRAKILYNSRIRHEEGCFKKYKNKNFILHKMS